MGSIIGVIRGDTGSLDSTSYRGHMGPYREMEKTWKLLFRVEGLGFGVYRWDFTAYKPHSNFGSVVH